MTTLSPPSTKNRFGSGFTSPISYPFSYSYNVYFQDGRLLTGILVSLLYLLLAISLDAAGYVQNMALLIPVCIGALALGMLMAYSRFDGFFALSHSLFTGLAWILYLMTALVKDKDVEQIVENGVPVLQAKAYFVLLQWLNWVDAAVRGTANNDNYVFIFEICFLLWWLTYLGVWSIFRYGYTWRAIVPAGIVLMINTYYAPQSVTGFLVVFCLIALVLLVRTNLAQQQLRWREQGIYFNPDITLDFLRNGFMYSIIVVALAWIVPGLGRSMPVQQILEPLNARWETTTERLTEIYGGLNRQTRPAGSAFGRELNLGGARNVGNRPVFQASTAAGRYWRAVVYDTFDGRTWHNTDENVIEFEADERIPVGGWSLREPLTQTITLLAPSGNVVFGAPDILQSSVPIVSRYGLAPTRPLAVSENHPDLPTNQSVELTQVTTRRFLEAGDSYVVISQNTQVTERAMESASDTYPAQITDRYLQLPEDFSPQVAEKALEVTADHETIYAKVKAVETFLRGYKYNEEIEGPKPNQDPVEYFLFDVQEGYCDYYATSMATMLRSLGIPARTASGYAEGTLDEEFGIYIVTERDAHTWVEVYFPGLGWIEFEPTAGEDPLERDPGTELPDLGDAENRPLPNNLGPDDPSALFGDDPLFDDGNFPNDEFLPGGSVGSTSGWSTWIWTILTPLLLIIGGFFLWRNRMFGPIAFTPDLPPILYERMHLWASRLGLRLSATQTPYEQAHQLGRALPEGRTFIQRITDTYVRYRFGKEKLQQVGAVSGPMVTGKAGLSSGQSSHKELSHSWKRLTSIFWRAWLRKTLARFSLRKNNPFNLVRK